MVARPASGRPPAADPSRTGDRPRLRERRLRGEAQIRTRAGYHRRSVAAFRIHRVRRAHGSLATRVLNLAPVMNNASAMSRGIQRTVCQPGWLHDIGSQVRAVDSPPSTLRPPRSGGRRRGEGARRARVIPFLVARHRICVRLVAAGGRAPCALRVSAFREARRRRGAELHAETLDSCSPLAIRFHRSASRLLPISCAGRVANQRRSFVSDPRTALSDDDCVLILSATRVADVGPALFGYHGCYLRVDVSTGRSSAPLAETVCGNSAAGLGWLMPRRRRLWRCVRARGAVASSSARRRQPAHHLREVRVVSKSPLTDRINDCSPAAASRSPASAAADDRHRRRAAGLDDYRRWGGLEPAGRLRATCGARRLRSRRARR